MCYEGAQHALVVAFSKRSHAYEPQCSSHKCYVTSQLSIKCQRNDLDHNSFLISLVSDASCELCGFDFENRKALASHARAHLRQLGIIEWKADGATSPIELLSELIRKDPVKVEAITRRYRMGDLYIKKVGDALKHPSGISHSEPHLGTRLMFKNQSLPS